MTKLQLPIGIGSYIDGGPFNNAEVAHVSEDEEMITFAAPEPWDPTTEQSSISAEDMADAIEDEVAADEPISVRTAETGGRRRFVTVEVEPHEYATLMFDDDVVVSGDFTEEQIEWANERLHDTPAAYGNL